MSKARRLALLAAAVAVLTLPACADTFDEMISRTSKSVAGFLDQFSQVKCTEQVTQEKFAPNGKVEEKEMSKYDYLVIMTNAGGELVLDESRLEDSTDKKRKMNKPLLVSNGFATLFLVFHPYYLNSFEFTDEGEDTVDGRRAIKVGYRHVRGTRTPMALSLRGKEYPLDMDGTAWIDPASGILLRISADIPSGMADLGMKSLTSSVNFAPVHFRDTAADVWFPTQATVEVETVKQHWRNTHHFMDYKQFSVSTEQTVEDKKLEQKK
jgi:hypothetical protein